MKESNTLKVFLSYSHKDENRINDFRKHVAPIRNGGLISDWYDRKIIAGDDFQNTIDNNLNNADVIILFISADFLASTACIKEKNKALELKTELGITVIPLILSPCGWLDEIDISKNLALPIDGNPITSFTDKDTAWNQVYEEFKKVIHRDIKLTNLKITDEFKDFLLSTDFFSKAHADKKEVLLDDIFVYPELEKFDDLKEFEKKYSAEYIFSDFKKLNKIVIAGSDQSGKTSLCKQLYKNLITKRLIPVYVLDKSNQFSGNIENRITKAFNEQYRDLAFESIDKQRIVPIIDDFHLAKKKEKHIDDLSKYKYLILIVDDIFSLNIKNENLIKSFYQFRIRQFSPSLRNKLITQWVQLTDKNPTIEKSNDFYKRVDTKTELVNTSLGKILSSGIMPSYPFFILSIVSTYDTFEKPLEQEITSQGYCYQALIYLFLRKEGVSNDDIDTYVNFLTEFAYFLFDKKELEVSNAEFNDFINYYTDNFNFHLHIDVFLKKLQNTRIINADSFNNYSFYYNYLYYFFVAKYLSDYQEKSKEEINEILNNLHVNENAYIAIFISHHSKSVYFLEELILNAMTLFEKVEPATLSKSELSFFDKNIDNIVKAVLPPKNNSPEKAREEILREQDYIEESKKEAQEEHLEIDDFAKELRRSIKTVEVMGRIIKNRAGSIHKIQLEEVFKQAMNVHLRILTSFFELIKNDSQQLIMVDFIKERLELILKEKSDKPKIEELEKLAKKIFWNLNFSVVFGFINKIIHSLGSDKMTPTIEKIEKELNTPSSFLVKHGIIMWYDKNLQVNNIIKRIDSDGFSETAKRIVRFMIVNHCYIHKINYADYQRIEQKFGIPQSRLMHLNKPKK